jgi:hypothetical protein
VDGEDFTWCGKKFDYQLARQYGKRVNQDYVNNKWKNLGIKREPIDSIGPLEGDDFPFNFEADANLDLVVAEKEVSSALTLLESFDLLICKASWNGQCFHIKDPHSTFSRCFCMEPNRKAIMQKYLSFTEAARRRHKSRHKVVDLAVKKLEAEGSYVQAGLKKYLPKGCDLHLGELLCDTADYQYHNFVCKLFLCLNRYLCRGLEIDVPQGATQFEIDMETGFDCC